MYESATVEHRGSFRHRVSGWLTVLLSLVVALCLSAGARADGPGGDAQSISAGDAHSCAVRSNGELACWGDDSAGQVSEAPEGEFRSVSAGGAFGCGVRSNGELACWGDDSAGQVSEVPEGEFRSVSAGGAFGCGVRADGTLACWGDDSAGQVSNMPTDVDDWHVHGRWFLNGHAYGHLLHSYKPRFIAVSAGGGHACAIEDDGGLACWGDDSAGQASDLPDGQFASISAGGAHSCAVRSNGELACWGDDAFGQVSGAPGGEFVGVSAGGAHGCALGGNGEAACWGDNGKGQAQPLIVSPPPPDGSVGSAYLHVFETTPEGPPAKFHLAGGQLPPGLALSESGELSGSPTSGGTYTFVVAAANEILPDAEQEATVNIAAPPPPPAIVAAQPPAGLPPPTAGQTVNVTPTRGVVRTKCPGKAVAKLLSPEQIPIECLIDVRYGTVDLESATGNGIETRSGFFWGGIFGVLQTKAHSWETELRLVGRRRCEKRKSFAAGKAAAHPSRRIHKRKRRRRGRRLWGSGKGNFRTSGSYGSASVRGTTWLVVDRCDNSTLFKVREGTVWVRDFVKQRLVVLKAGHSYIAKAAIPRLR